MLEHVNSKPKSWNFELKQINYKIIISSFTLQA